MKVHFYSDYFVDYNNKVHKFIICAVTSNLSKEAGHIILAKSVKFGIAICNPCDTFDTKLGLDIAQRKAENSDNIVYSTKSGVLNDNTINYLLKQEAEYVKKNPGCYIKGYREAEKIFNQNKEKEAKRNYIYNGLTSKEKEIYKYFKDSKESLNKINELIDLN